MIEYGMSDNRYILKDIEESPCSHAPETGVVFVPDETISQGSTLITADGCEIT